MQETRRRSAQAWRELVTRFSQSGLTEEAFCEREGLGVKMFHSWRFKRSSVTPRPPADKTARVSIPSAGFMDLGTLKSGGSRLDLRLDLGGGVTLHLVRE